MPLDRADDAKASSAVASQGLWYKCQRPAKLSAKNKLSVYAAEQKTDAGLTQYRSVATDAVRFS